MNGWSGGGEPLGREEDAREEPHRQHDQVHQPADRLGGAGPAGDQQADAGERERADHVDADHQHKAAADRHVEHERAQQEQHGQVGDQEGQPGPEKGQQEIAPGHGRGDEPLEQLGDPEVDQQEADAPEPAPHGVEPDQARGSGSRCSASPAR